MRLLIKLGHTYCYKQTNIADMFYNMIFSRKQKNMQSANRFIFLATILFNDYFLCIQSSSIKYNNWLFWFLEQNILSNETLLPLDTGIHFLTWSKSLVLDIFKAPLIYNCHWGDHKNHNQWKRTVGSHRRSSFVSTNETWYDNDTHYLKHFTPKSYRTQKWDHELFRSLIARWIYLCWKLQIYSKRPTDKNKWNCINKSKTKTTKNQQTLKVEATLLDLLLPFGTWVAIFENSFRKLCCCFFSNKNHVLCSLLPVVLKNDKTQYQALLLRLNKHIGTCRYSAYEKGRIANSILSELQKSLVNKNRRHWASFHFHVLLNDMTLNTHKLLQNTIYFQYGSFLYVYVGPIAFFFVIAVHLIKHLC